MSVATVAVAAKVASRTYSKTWEWGGEPASLAEPWHSGGSRSAVGLGAPGAPASQAEREERPAPQALGLNLNIPPSPLLRADHVIQ